MTEQKPQAPTYGERTLGLSTCGFGTGDPECGHPAIVHALFDDDEGHNGIMCVRHWIIFQAHFAYVDVHEFGGACTMPGSAWVHSTVAINEVVTGRIITDGGCTIPLVEEPAP